MAEETAGRVAPAPNAGEDGVRPALVTLGDVEERDLPILFDQRDPEANRMAAFPARDREAFMAHWTRILADDAVTTKTIVVDGGVAGNIVSWEEGGARLLG